MWYKGMLAFSSSQPILNHAQVKGTTQVPTTNCITGSNAKNGAHSDMSDSAKA
jgi:hypothetical protein